MNVIIKHAPNPDIKNGGYWDGKPDINNVAVMVRSYAEASNVCRAFIEKTGLGGGNWIGGQIFNGGKRVARVSFNGRIWNNDGKEIVR